MKGQFLMAMPGLMDPNFFQTVTCISEHTEAGAVGIVVNRVHPYLSAKS
ncbi:MAG: YqgE/AlgH family protein, partial [Deltaproteobacteria bacterium]|nr:YqgE/AlgH family protein [Deltaproteobacteria bacterium]